MALKEAGKEYLMLTIRLPKRRFRGQEGVKWTKMVLWVVFYSPNPIVFEQNRV